MSLDILIIGLGRIGFRHFQSVYNSKIFKKIIIVEKDKKKIKEIKDKYRSNKVFFFEKIPNNLKKIHWLLIATSSKDTYFVFKEVVSKIKVKNILFEKLISYEINKIKKINKVLKKKKIKGYLNLPRKTFVFYKKIKKLLIKKPIDYYISGDTRLASNLIHQLDIFLFLSSSKKIKLIKSQIDNNILKSKRSGYREFRGYLEFITENGSKLTICDRKKTMRGFLDFIRIENKNVILNIIESKSAFNIINKKNNKSRIINIRLPLQSEITSNLIKNIKINNICDFEKSNYYHFLIIKLFDNFLRKFGKKLKDYPIT